MPSKHLDFTQLLLVTVWLSRTCFSSKLNDQRGPGKRIFIVSKSVQQQEYQHAACTRVLLLLTWMALWIPYPSYPAVLVRVVDALTNRPCIFACFSL